MAPFLLGIGLFGLATIFTLTLKKVSHLTYNSNPFIFGCLFSFLLAVVHYIYPLFSYKEFLSAILVGLCYVVLMSLLQRFNYLTSLFGAETLPEIDRGIIKPQRSGDIVKVIEVFLQDVSAWLTVLGLLYIFQNIYVVVIIFTLVVFLFHLPGIFIFGKVYGTYFLVTSTLLAFVVPLFVQLGTISLLFVFGIHLCMYLLMYVFMSWLGRRY